MQNKASLPATIVTPISNIGNEVVAQDMRFVSSLWGEREEEAEEDIH